MTFMTFGCYYIPRPPNLLGPLNTEKKLVPLLSVHAEGTLCDFTAQVTLNQRYKNLESHPIELEYVFPVDELGAVCKFEVEVDGKKIIGKIMDKDKAADTYDDAIAAGSGAYMLKQNTEESASCMIGNLPPQKECIVKITYVTELPPEDGKIKFVLPTTIAPLYNTSAPVFGANQVQSHGTNTGLTIDFNLNMASAIRSISSSTHPLDFELDGTKARVRLGNASASMDQDLIILIGVQDAFTPRLWVEKNGNEYNSMAIFYPSLVASYPAAEIIFVVDQSGSMSGTQMEDAKSALQILLRSIPEGCKFNIVGFGSTFQVMAQKSVMYDQNSFATATNLINNMTANLGGTNLKNPLEWVFRQEASFAFPRQVFVITDGQIEDTQVVLNMVSRCSGYEPYPKVKKCYAAGVCTYQETKNVFAPQHWFQCRTCNMVETLGLCAICKTTCHAGHDVIGPFFSDFFCDCAESTTRKCIAMHQSHQVDPEIYKNSTRVFALGIGAGVDRNLVTGLARVGRGTSVFVKTGEKMEKKVVGQLKVSMQPALTDVSLEWSVISDSFPKSIPPLFNRNRLISYSTGFDKPTSVTLKAMADCQVPVSAVANLASGTTNGLIQKLVAKAKLKDLEEQHKKAEAVKVSVQNQVLSTYTAYVAVEERKDSVTGTMESVKIVAQAPRPAQVNTVNAPFFSFASVPMSGPMGFGAPSPAYASQSAAFGSPMAAFGSPMTAFGGTNTVSPSHMGAGFGGSSAGYSSFGMASPNRPASLAAQPSFSPTMSLAAAPTSIYPSLSPLPPPPPPHAGSSSPFASAPRPAAQAADLLDLFGSAPSVPPSVHPQQNLSYAMPQSLQQPQQQQQQLQQQQLFQQQQQQQLFQPAPQSLSMNAQLPHMQAERMNTAPQQTPHQRLTTIMQLQAFNGSWSLDSAFANAINVALHTLTSLRPADASDAKWATALAIAFLEIKLGSLRDAWEMAAQKSSAFVADPSLLANAKQIILAHCK